MNPWRNYLCFNPKGWVIAGYKVVWVTRNLEAMINGPKADIRRSVRMLANYNRMWGRSSMTAYCNPAREVEFVCDE